MNADAGRRVAFGSDVSSEAKSPLWLWVRESGDSCSGFKASASQTLSPQSGTAGGLAGVFPRIKRINVV